MFSVHCPTHGAEVLLSERRIRAIVQTTEGLRVEWTCWCGTTGAFLTGRPPSAVAPGRQRPAC